MSKQPDWIVAAFGYPPGAALSPLIQLSHGSAVNAGLAAMSQATGFASRTAFSSRPCGFLSRVVRASMTSLQIPDRKQEFARRSATIPDAETEKRFMKPLVPRITNATTRRHLREFANRVVEPWFCWPFSEPFKIVSCRVLGIVESPDLVSPYLVRRHGGLGVAPDDAARAIAGS